jgi:outer membrane protein TolC
MNPLIALALALATSQAPAAEAAPAPAADASAKPAPVAPPPAAPGPATAAPAASAPAPAAAVVTLDEALGLVADRNLDLRAAQARLRQSQQSSWKAWSAYLPHVTASGAYTHNEVGAEIPAGVFGAGSPAITIIPQDQLAGQIEATQAIFSPAAFFGIRAAYRGEDVAQYTIEGVRRDVLFGTAQAYYGVASLRRTVEVSERLLEVAQRQEKDARVRFQAGTIAKVGLLRAEIDRARAEQDVRRARNSYESARIGLATLLDRPVDFEVADPPEPQLPSDMGQIEETALRDRTDVAAARASIELSRSSRSAVLGLYLPNVGAFGRYTGQNAAGFTGKETTWAVGVGVQWNILDGGLREANLREANARIAEAEATAASAEAKARQEVRQSLLDLESARANAAKAKEQRDLAAENQRLVDVSYRAGAATAVEQADATAQLRNAELAFTAETLGAQLSALRVLKVAGRSLR